MGSCAAPSAKGDDKFITTDYLQQCRQAFVRGIEQQGNIRINWLDEGKPVTCLAHYQQSAAPEKIAQSIILNGISCQIK
ncbi:hypothetical protein EXX39_24470 [Escherichia coli]|nr:hypothetical protein EXX39_24470 [Escherichia coli]